VGRNHRQKRWPLRRFAVVEDSMRPALNPGDGLVALRGGAPRRGQLRVFSDPTLPSRWLVKRVGGVRGEGRGATFEARSDNPNAPGVVDSRQFGWVPAAGSYRVVWTVSRRDRRDSRTG
jgi:Signal peptidase, peptidase S26